MEYDGMEEDWGVYSTQSSGQYSLKIIFYLHLPFPSYEIFRQLPLRTSLLRGVLASDLIGTHTYSSWASTTTCSHHPRLTPSTSARSCTARRWTRSTRSSPRSRRAAWSSRAWTSCTRPTRSATRSWASTASFARRATTGSPTA